MEKNRIWEGRIRKDPDSRAVKFTSSIDVDKQLYKQDLTGSAAYAIGLESIGIITPPELKKIMQGLKKVRNDIESGKIDYGKYEDIHSLIEFELGAFAGQAAKKIHTGRSRNDQVVVDELIFLKESILETLKYIINLEDVILKKSAASAGLVFSAYTHMQKAQPVLISHYLLSYFEKFLRNMEKLSYTFDSCDFLPLGAAACTGSGYNINTGLLTGLLKFGRAGSNSMDIVSSRDYIIDYIYCCSMVMLNLSRFCEDLVIYNTQEFSGIIIDDSFCTGSSIMPQKKNPDILELIRGKSAVVIGNLTQMMILMKGLPSTYNSDMQEDKKILFNAKKDTLESIDIFTRLLENIEFTGLKTDNLSGSGFIEATDAADYLVKKGESFRNAHHITGKIIKYCLDNNVPLNSIPVEKLKKYSKYFGPDFKNAIQLKSCINSKITGCGTSEKSVRASILKSKKTLEKFKKALNSLKDRIPDFDELAN